MTQDHTIPRNLTDSLFRDLQLPQNSRIHTKQKNNATPMTLAQSKYKEQDDDQIFTLQLGEDSKIINKIGENSGSGNSVKSKSTQQQTRPSPTNARLVSKIQRKRNNKKPEIQEKPKIDIDNEIGQIAQWAQKGAQNNSDQEDFNQNDKVGETAEQQQIKKKIQEKLRNGFGQKNTGGLKAKADQLRRQKETSSNMPVNAINQSVSKQKQKQKQKDKNITPEHQTSTSQLEQQKENNKKIISMDQQQDDPWQNVNQQTLQKHKETKEKRKNMTVQSVLVFYQNQFQFDENDIELQVENQPEQSKKQEQTSCFEILFSCLKSEPKKITKTPFNTKIAKRLIAISKKQLSNGEEEFFVLKEIWNRLTQQPFSRYGSHWNKIGFQGRDPATDLRSTGVLSILQWLSFMQKHSKLSQEYSKWSMEIQFPLALTHIKVTGSFLDLLCRGAIKGNTWSDFENSYNALLIDMFQKMMSQYKSGDTLGTIVEDQARNIKLNYKKAISSYQSKYNK